MNQNHTICEGKTFLKRKIWSATSLNVCLASYCSYYKYICMFFVRSELLLRNFTPFGPISHHFTPFGPISLHSDPFHSIRTHFTLFGRGPIQSHFTFYKYPLNKWVKAMSFQGGGFREVTPLTQNFSSPFPPTIFSPKFSSFRLHFKHSFPGLYCTFNFNNFNRLKSIRFMSTCNWKQICSAV